MRIILIEDDPLFQRIIKTDLEDEGHEVTVWGCMQGAIELIQNGNFDLLIVDIILPMEQDSIGDECRDGGIRVLERLSKIGVCCPTIIVSVKDYDKANQERIDSLKLLNFGDDVSTYFRKPYDEYLFLSTIRRIEEHLLVQRANGA